MKTQSSPASPSPAAPTQAPDSAPLTSERKDLTGITFVSPNHSSKVFWIVERYHRGGNWVCRESEHHTTMHFHEKEIASALAHCGSCDGSGAVLEGAQGEQHQATCPTCDGRGEIGGPVGQTPESFEYRTEACPDCAPAAHCPSASHLPLVAPVGVTGSEWKSEQMWDNMSAVPAPVSPSLPAHTPLPWRLKLPQAGTLQKAKVLGPPHPVDGGDYAALAEMDPGDASLVVRSVNEFATLKADVERLIGALRQIANPPVLHLDDYHCCTVCKQWMPVGHAEAHDHLEGCTQHAHLLAYNPREIASAALSLAEVGRK